MSEKKYDLVIVGAGPAGIATAIEAQKNNLHYVIIEKGYLVNSIYNFPTNMTFFSTSLKLEIGDVPFISHLEKPTRKEALEYYRRVSSAYKLNIQYQSKVEIIDTINKEFEITVNGNCIKSKFVVIATGYFDTPRMLNVTGEDLPKVRHYYDDAHPYIGTNVMIVGAANSACDVALETWQKGAKVTMVVRGSELYQKTKYWILPNIQNRIKEGSIKAFFNSEIRRIEKNFVEINTPDGLQKVDNDFVLAMTGYKPDYKFLKSIGVKINESKPNVPNFNPDTLESNIPNMYLAGVIIAGLNTSELFIENTRDHGKKIVRAIISSLS